MVRTTVAVMVDGNEQAGLMMAQLETVQSEQMAVLGRPNRQLS